MNNIFIEFIGDVNVGKTTVSSIFTGLSTGEVKRKQKEQSTEREYMPSLHGWVAYQRKQYESPENIRRKIRYTCKIRRYLCCITRSASTERSALK